MCGHMLDPQYIAEVLSQKRPRDIIAITACGEAENLGLTGMTATINTGQNRVNSGIQTFGSDLVGVFTFRDQYSCLRPDNARLPYLLKLTDDDPTYSAALVLADQALAGTLSDLTHGSTHYFAPNEVESPPDWAVGPPRFTCGNQLYYRVKPY